MKQEQMELSGVLNKKAHRERAPRLKDITETPVSRSQLTHSWMLEYTAANGTPEQCAALLDFVEKNQIERESHLKTAQGTKYTITDISPMRDLFCDMFFPELKENKSYQKKETALEMAKRLLSEKAAAANKPAVRRKKTDKTM